MQDVSQLRTTCILQDITPGIYTIEVNTSIIIIVVIIIVRMTCAIPTRSELNFLSPLSAEGRR